MVVRMMKWRPWPPLSSNKFHVTIAVSSLQGLPETTPSGSMGVEVEWKGSVVKAKKNRGIHFKKRSKVRRDVTEERLVNVNVNEDEDGVVEWNQQQFVAVCDLVGFGDGCFHRWDVAFKVFHVSGLNQGPKTKKWNHVVATGSLNLAEFASIEHEKTPINIHLSMPNTKDCSPMLSVSLSIIELKDAAFEPTQRYVNGGDEPVGLKAGLKKVKIFKVIMSKHRAKKAACLHEEEDSVGKSSVRTDSSDYPFDTDSYDGIDSEEIDYSDSNIKESFGYGTLAYANHAAGGFGLPYFLQSNDIIYFQSHNNKTKRSDALGGEFVSNDRSESHISKKGIFPWRKRKLSFRSPKVKGEPLLKPDAAEGGDDIDFDRRMLTSSSHRWQYRSDDDDSTASRSSTSEFGDDGFIIGAWENKEIINRDGNMKLATQVFFASIDQTSEKACGESACTSLAATIANWLQTNPCQLPIKSEFDTLIRQGSLEWRNLCENEDYKKRFPDKHFDLDTVLESKTDRSFEVVPEKSFIGFFQLEDGGGFDFLEGAMSFDNIWDEISQTASNDTEPLVYIVSWNDHFFTLKVEEDAYYIIDTLGERLYEGCSQAYVLRFDQNTRIQQQKSKGIVSKGKESCKEYIKSFLAAIPLRELQGDVKKGLISASSPIAHHRLQIEFHYTRQVVAAACD